MIPSNTELLNVTGSGPVDGAWFTVFDGEKFQVPVNVSITAGTATVVVEGRNSPNDTPVQVLSVSASGGSLQTRWRQMRARLTAASAASVVVSVDVILKH